MSEPGAIWTYLPLLPLKARNIVLDCIFYDVANLSPDDQFQLLLAPGLKGSIVVVPPSGQGAPLRFYDSALAFMTAEGDDIRAISIAGVGSSIYGTVALARNVADAIGMDVAGIVSGYGLSDFLQEAWGGWFFFGALDRIQRAAEDVVQHLVSLSPDAPKRGFLNLPFAPFDPGVPGWGIPGDEDSATLGDILLSRPRNLDLLVGHSKGSLIIDNALEQFVYDLSGLNHYLLEKLHIVTLGAVADLPDRFPRVTQIIGGTDWFGGLNSRPDVFRHPWLLSFHHLNRKLPYHLDAVEALRTFA